MHNAIVNFSSLRGCRSDLNSRLYPSLEKKQAAWDRWSWIKLWTWFCWKLVISVRNLVLFLSSFTLPWLLQLLLLTFHLFSGWRCVKLCKGIAWTWAFRSVNGDMGLQFSLITCVDFPGVRRQKPLVSRQDLQQEFCAKGKSLVVWLSSHLYFLLLYKCACLHRTVH